jgi:PAS domain-containing protein
MAPVPLDDPRLTLAVVEAHVGSLVDVLPVALLVTSSSGEIVRANAAAIELLRNPLPLVGQAVASVLEVARRRRALEVRVRWLRHEDDALRLYVIQAQSWGSTLHGPLPGAPRRGIRSRSGPMA